MKRTLALLPALALLLALLPGCGQETGGAPDRTAGGSGWSACGLAGAALQSAAPGETLDLEILTPEDDTDRLAVYVEAVCGLTRENWEDAAVIRGLGASAFEIVVLRLPDADAAEALEPVLADYLTAREGAFTGYAPAEAEMAANGRVLREGRTVALFICPDPEGAAGAFTSAYNGDPSWEGWTFTPDRFIFQTPEGEGAAADPEGAAEGPEPLVIPLRDVLHRLLLEAACPEWRSVNKYWMAPDDSRSAVGYWAPDDSGQWTPGGVLHLEDEPFWYALEYEVTVFRADSEEKAGQWAADMNGELKQQEARYREAGDETKAELMASGCAVSSGCWAALIVSDHAEDAALLFPRIVNDPETIGYFDRLYSGEASPVITDPDPDYPDRVRFTPPGEEDMSIYDTSAILAAWEKKDPSALRGYDREVYDMAADILPDGDLSDLEKEEAVYRWLVDNVNYDWTHQDVLTETERWSYEPYGALIKRSAVCLGYATSFQLLMNMSGVECITVVGAAFNSTGDHAWNMVKLNGEWYCADVTWDANGRQQRGDACPWRYFNLTSDEMAKNHQWDYANTPEATAADLGRG